MKNFLNIKMEELAISLEHLDEKTLINLALVNKQLKLLALRQLALNKFGTLFYELKENLSEEQWYSFLFKIEISVDYANDSAEKGDLKSLIILEKKGVLPTVEWSKFGCSKWSFEYFRMVRGEKMCYQM